MSEWKFYEFEQCPICGNDIEVFTNQPNGYVVDGDQVRCVQCNFESSVSIDDEEIFIKT